MIGLAPGTIRVWVVGLTPGAGAVAALFGLLAADEQARARRYHFPADHDRFVACRAALRQVLAFHTGLDAAGLGFTHGPQGKPALVGSGVDFNVSHSGDRALIALSADGAVGVDVEWVRPISEMDVIARRYFSPDEQAALAALAPDARTLGFYQAWTRKEAMLKATGHGLSRALDHYTVSLGPNVEPRVLAVAGAPEEVATWRLADLEPEVGYVGAIAWQGGGRSVVVAPWPQTTLDHS